MKISAEKNSLQGNTILLVMIFTGIVTLSLASYLSLTSGASKVGKRSLSWNAALPMAEAAIEEGMCQILTASGGGRATNGWTNLTAFSSAFTYQKWRTIGDGFYTATLVPSNPGAAIGPLNPPILYGSGFVRPPVSSNYISRTVRATTQYRRYFDYAMLARSTISMSGGSLLDSYDSSDANYNTGGFYDPAKASAHAHLGAMSGTAGAISVGTGRVYGDGNVAFGGTMTVGSSGAVGDAAYLSKSANNGTIEPGHFQNNLNESFSSASAPYTNGASLVAPAGPIGGTNYTWVAGNTNNYYYSGDFQLSGGQSMIVTSAVTLYVKGSVNISGSGFIYLTPNASLTLYIYGPSAQISGSGVVNGSQNAANFSLIGLPTLTSGNYSGSSKFIGTVYAPNADWTLSGSAGAYGAVVANSFNLSGGMNLHYDEGLSSKGKAPYYFTSWQEL